MAASSASFGPQWPSRNPHIVVLVRSDGLRLPIHEDLADLVSMLMDLTEAMGYDINPKWTWGYANRPISGTQIPSNHSRGCAVDINAPVNPYASLAWHIRNANAHPFGLPRRTNIPQRVFELWEAHGFQLGVRYSSKPDPMHFEFTESRNACRRITRDLAAFLNHPPSALPKPTPPTVQEDDDMGNTVIIKSDAPGATSWYVSDGVTKRNLGTAAITKQEEANLLVFVFGVGAGAPSGSNQQPVVVDADFVNAIRTI